jgi:hypothetical protein
MSDRAIPAELCPTASLARELGSSARHVDEASGRTGIHSISDAVRALVEDDVVVRWMAAADALALLPVSRG